MKNKSFIPIIILFVAAFNLTASIMIIAKDCEALRIQKHPANQINSLPEIII